MKRPKPRIGRPKTSDQQSFRRLSEDQDRYMGILSEILRRRRRKVPFPLPLEAVYYDLFPAYIDDICKPPKSVIQPVEREIGIMTRRANLQAALSHDPLVRVELSNTRPQQAFYMRFEKPMIVPSDNTTYLQLPTNHRHFLSIRDWVSKAQVLDNRNDDIVTKIVEFFRAAHSDAVARKVWPFLMDAVKSVGPSHPVGPTAIAHVDHVVSRHQRGYIEEAIAEGMMLDPYVPDAWIGYGPEG